MIKKKLNCKTKKFDIDILKIYYTKLIACILLTSIRKLLFEIFFSKMNNNYADI